MTTLWQESRDVRSHQILGRHWLLRIAQQPGASTCTGAPDARTRCRSAPRSRAPPTRTIPRRPPTTRSTMSRSPPPPCARRASRRVAAVAEAEESSTSSAGVFEGGRPATSRSQTGLPLGRSNRGCGSPSAGCAGRLFARTGGRDRIRIAACESCAEDTSPEERYGRPIQRHRPMSRQAPPAHGNEGKTISSWIDMRT